MGQRKFIEILMGWICIGSCLSCIFGTIAGLFLIRQKSHSEWLLNLDWADSRQEAPNTNLLQSWQTEPFIDVIVVEA